MIDLVVSVEIWLGIETFWECHKSVIFVRHSIILPICPVDVETQALRQLKINHNLLSINVHYNRFAYLTHQREGGNLRPRRWGNPQTSGREGNPQTSGETLNHRRNPQPQERGNPRPQGGALKPQGKGNPPSQGKPSGNRRNSQPQPLWITSALGNCRTTCRGILRVFWPASA